jgi:hypothetical protein
MYCRIQLGYAEGGILPFEWMGLTLKGLIWIQVNGRWVNLD